MMPRLWQALTLLAAAPAFISALTFDCDGVNADGHTLILKKLAGPKTVHIQEDTGVSVHNTTFTIDMCNKLKHNSSMPSEEQCEDGTRICAVKKLWHNNEAELEEVVHIAGEYTYSEGMHLEPDVRWLESGASHEDSEKKGFRVTLNGGRHPFKQRSGMKQQAIIEFICNPNVTGNEGFESDAAFEKREEGDDEDEAPTLPELDKGKSLSFVSYKEREDIKILRLKWETKYACAEAMDEPPAQNGSHWGFFTWFIIVVFLLAAAYIIFGSWLNYNRYGARGWDLIPHGDTIRDLPYILKDLFSNLMSRIRGEGGSRGGYAAV